MKRKGSAVLVFAVVMTLALTGAAVAAGMSIFARIRETKVDETSYERLGLLEDAAASIGETCHLKAPAATNAKAPETDRERLMLSQHDFAADLTIDQVYCDERRLYYSYTFSSETPRVELGEGKPTGFETWTEYPGGRFGEDVFMSLDGEETESEVSRWLSSHKSAYVVRHSVYPADGAKLEDGTELRLVDGGYMGEGENHYIGYTEVMLPEGYEAGEEVRFVLTMLGGTRVVYQDEEGVSEAYIYQPECNATLTVAAPVSKPRDVLRGSIQNEEYAAEAEIYVSDVDISGTVTITGPQEIITDYVLLVNGEEQRGFPFGVIRRDETSYTLDVRYDLPKEEIRSLALLPVGGICEDARDEEIPLR